MKTRSYLKQEFDIYEGSREEVKTFLLEKMPLTRLLLPWFIALLTLFMMAWSWYSEIDIVSSTRGVIIPNSRLQFIQSSASNVVDSIPVREGDAVHEGDVLVVFLQADKLSERIKVRETILKIEAKTYRLKAMSHFFEGVHSFINPPSHNPFLAQEIAILEVEKSVHRSRVSSLEKKIETFEADRNSLKLEIELLESIIPHTIDEIRRSKRLLEQGIIGREKLDALSEKLIRQSKEKQIKQTRIFGLDSEIEYQKETNRLHVESQKHEIALELLKLDQEYRILKQDISKLDSEVRLKNLVSPISGTVNKILIHTQGAVVQSGERIMSIVPQDSPLEVDAKIMNQDVGFIKEGQTVSVKLDSFNFTRYGKLNGTIRRIAMGAVEDPQLGMVYPTIIELANQKIEVDGKLFSLKPGMTVTIDIKTGNRKIADYIIEPFLRYSDEALRER